MARALGCVASILLLGCSDSSTGPNGGAPALTNSILFVSNRTGDDQIYSMSADGSNLAQLTSIPGQKADVTISNDGRAIAFAVYPNNYELVTQLYVMGSDGTGLKKLTDTRFFDNQPSFSDDGKKIFFSRSAGDSSSIYEMNADGSHLLTLIHHHGLDYGVKMKPGGTSLLFVSDRDHLGGANHEIYSANGLGLDIHPLVEGSDPAWSSDGQKFLFERDSQIWISDTPDGSSVHQLSSFQGSNFTPSWSPDGQRIIYTGYVQSHAAIFSLDIADPSSPHQLTTFDSLGDCTFSAYTHR